MLLVALPSAFLDDDCEKLRQENLLLKQLLALQSKISPSPVGGADSSGSPTWTTSSYTSTFPTTVTVPISTEVPIILNGKFITTTIVDYETKETIGTTILPTRVLAYPTQTKPAEEINTNKADSTPKPEEVTNKPDTSTNKNQKIPPKTAITKKPSYRPSLKQALRGRKNSATTSARKPKSFASRSKSKPKSFQITRFKSNFGSKSSSFNRFRRDTPTPPQYVEYIDLTSPYVEILSSMEE